MPPRSRRLPFPDHAVTTVLVSHDGAAWLPECTAALAAQTRPPQRVVAVDTGSTDDSPALLSAALGESAVLTRPRTTGLGEAIQAGLDAFSGAPEPPGVPAGAKDWVWILHDDCAPEPGALQALLERAEEAPTAVVIGPKVLSWDHRRLLEVGVTVDSSGFRETGLEPRELDQGQHDEVGDVLAVGTAGMLVRRETWDTLGGLDPAWPLVGDDVDFGWRVNAAGGRVVIATRAIVRHAEALTARRRRPDAIALPAGAAARAHGMQLVLANTSPWLVPVLAVRYLVEGVLRVLGALLLLRSVGRARDEIVGVAVALSRPHVVFAARRRRAKARRHAHHEIRGLLAPAGWRWRHAGDAVAAVLVGRAAVDQRQRRRAPVETGPVDEQSESFTFDDLGVLTRLFTRPGVLLFLALTAVALAADRSVLGAVHGGRLLPSPGGASDLWSSYVAGWHPVDLGSTTAAPPIIAVLAALSTLALGKVWLAVAIVMLGAVPLAGLSAYLAAGVLTRRLRLRLLAAVAYAFLPALLGGVAGGRIDVVLAAILAPLAARAVAASVRRPALHRSVGAGLLLAVLTAATPVVWPLTVVVLAIAVATVSGRDTLRARILAAVTTLAVAPVVLLPWTRHVATSTTLLLGGSGLPETFASRHGLPVEDLLLMRPGGSAMPPLWVWAPVVALAVVAQMFVRIGARVGFLLFAAGTGAALAVSRLTPLGPVANARYWAGAPLVVAALGALTAAVVAADEGPAELRRRAFGWRHAVAAVLAAAAVVGVAVAGLGWLARGSDHPLSASTTSVLPVFAQAEAVAPTSPRVLVLRERQGTVRYALIRGAAGLRLPDADLVARHVPASARHALDTAIADAAAGRAKAFDELAELGISLVVVPNASDGADRQGALARLADVDGLARVPATSTVVFRLTKATGELVMYDGTAATAAAAGAALPTSSAAHALTASPGHAEVTLPSGTGGRRLLVLSEPRSRSWRATVDGHVLARASAYGWAQAWWLPEDGGHLVVEHVGGHRHTLVLIEGVLVLLALVLCVPNRGRQQ